MLWFSVASSDQGQILFSLVWPVMQVLSRLAPFERGIYEDYVANFWCSTSILIKWKRLFTTVSLKLLSFSATFISVLPSMIQQIRDPSNHSFLYALLNSSFSFYLFSFQGIHHLPCQICMYWWTLLSCTTVTLYYFILWCNWQCTRSLFYCLFYQRAF